MTNQEYRDMLERLPLRKKGGEDLTDLFTKVFGQKPQRRVRKNKVVEKLYNKFVEMNDSPDADEPMEQEAQEEASTEEAPKEVKTRPASRRGKIIEMLQENVWDIKSMAEALVAINPEWPVAKNKAAISGTMADLRKNKGWIIKIDDNGKIQVKVPS